MLESIKVTERLHWPEVEMSKHHVLLNSSSSAAEKTKTTPPPASPPMTSSHPHHHHYVKVDRMSSSSPPTASHHHHQVKVDRMSSSSPPTASHHRVKVDRMSSSSPPTASHHHRHGVHVDRMSPSSPPTASHHRHGVHVDRLSPSSVLRNLLSSNSYNVLLQAEEQRDRQRHRHSPHPSPQQQQQQKGAPYRRAKTSSSRCTSTFQKRNRSCVTASRAVAGGRAPQGNAGGSIKSNSAVAGTFSNVPVKTSAARSISVLGSPMGLSPRPAPRPRKPPPCSSSPRATKLPALPPRPSWSLAPGPQDGGRKLCILTAIKPCNVEKEKVKFFKSDFAYNPQFEYSSPVSPLVLARHSAASDRFLTQAVRIMELALKKYGNYEKFEQETGGNLLTKSRVWFNVKKYMEKEGCVGEIVVNVTDDLLSRASMTVVNCRPTLTINISTAREHWLEGMLRHEIGTHYFRGINNSHQPWSSGVGRRRHNLKPLNPTEEGLASIHSVLFRKDPTLWRAALLYYTVYQASHMSFSQLYHSLGRFVQDPSTRWDYCVRAKRGQTNTALPGCFSKDQVYLDGILKILRYREKINFPMLMALGKVSFEDVERLKGVAQMDNVRIPHFLQDHASYAKQLDRIMEVNQLTDEELRVII